LAAVVANLKVTVIFKKVTGLASREIGAQADGRASNLREGGVSEFSIRRQAEEIFSECSTGEA
jgi:hypothetical protein